MKWGEGGTFVYPRFMTHAYNIDTRPASKPILSIYATARRKGSYEESPPPSYDPSYLPYIISPPFLPVPFNTFAEGVGVSP